MPHSPVSLRHLLLALLALLVLLGAMALAHRLGSERALQRENEQVQRQLQLHAQALRQRIDRYRTLPQVLALV